MSKNLSNKKKHQAVERILRTVPYEDGFIFYIDIGQPTKNTATSLEQFAKELEVVDIKSVNFHFERADFQKWISKILEDIELSRRLDKIPKDIVGELLRKEIIELVKARKDELIKFQFS
jgi:Family of unknown function (DUF5752)